MFIWYVWNNIRYVLPVICFFWYVLVCSSSSPDERTFIGSWSELHRILPKRWLDEVIWEERNSFSSMNRTKMRKSSWKQGSMRNKIGGDEVEEPNWKDTRTLHFQLFQSWREFDGKRTNKWTRVRTLFWSYSGSSYEWFEECTERKVGNGERKELQEVYEGEMSENRTRRENSSQ